MGSPPLICLPEAVCLDPTGGSATDSRNKLALSMCVHPTFFYLATPLFLTRSTREVLLCATNLTSISLIACRVVSSQVEFGLMRRLDGRRWRWRSDNTEGFHIHTQRWSLWPVQTRTVDAKGRVRCWILPAAQQVRWRRRRRW